MSSPLSSLSVIIAGRAMCPMMCMCAPGAPLWPSGRARACLRWRAPLRPARTQLQQTAGAAGVALPGRYLLCAYQCVHLRLCGCNWRAAWSPARTQLQQTAWCGWRCTPWTLAALCVSRPCARGRHTMQCPASHKLCPALPAAPPHSTHAGTCALR